MKIDIPVSEDLDGEQQLRDELGEIQAMFEDAKGAVALREPVMQESMAFYRGMQWGVMTPLGWMQDGGDPDEAREVINYIRPTVKTALADVLRGMPNPETVASSSDQRSVARAEASQRLLRSFIRNGTVSFEVMLRCEAAVLIHGAAWYKAVWDPSKGKQTANGPEGAISVQFVDILSAPPDPHARTEDEIEHVFHRKLVPVRVLQDQFPVDVFGVPSNGRWTAGDRTEGLNTRDLLENDGRSIGRAGSAGGMQSKGNDLAELVEFWERPTNAHPQGRLTVFSGGMLVAHGPMPYDWPWILRLGQGILPSGLFPDGIVRDCIPIQRSINMNASKQKEWVQNILNPPLLVPSGSQINRDLFSDMTGEIIEYTHGMKPSWMDVPDIPVGMFNMEAQGVSALQTISTYSDISRGTPPPGLESGRALANLYEIQKGVHEPDIHLFKLDIARVLIACLKLARDFFDDGRMVRLIGANNRWAVASFKRDDYDFEAEVVVEAFSSRPNSRALRQTEAIELFEKGAFADDPEAKALRRVLDFDYEDAGATMRMDAHLSRALSEHVELLSDPSFVPFVLEQDNDDIHLDHHNEFAITPEFLALPDFVRERHLQHIKQHEMNHAQKTQAFAAEQSLLSGQSQAPGGGAPPPAAPMSAPPDGGSPELPPDGAGQPV